MSETRINWGECSNEDCEQPCPWDMSGIILFDEIFCSPECAKAGLEAMPDTPREVALHDPQFVVDRESVNAPSDMVDFVYEGSGPEDMVDACANLYGVEFRPITVD